MDVDLIFHCERTDEPGNPLCWWIESPQLPGLYAGGDSMDEARELALEALEAELGPIGAVSERVDS